MRNWSAELKYRNMLLADRAKALLNRNAQSAPEDLMAMSYRYRALMDSMKQNMRMIDKRVLSLFNDKQYNLYITLCKGVAHSPLYVDRQVDEK
ncbi:MAG: hypothetical protein AAGB24_08110 [Bacteroidota bacterium]